MYVCSCGTVWPSACVSAYECVELFNLLGRVDCICFYSRGCVYACFRNPWSHSRMVFSLLGGTFDFQARFSSHFFIGVHVPLVQWAYSYPSLERLCGTLFLSVVSICQDTLLGRPVSFSKVFCLHTSALPHHHTSVGAAWDS